MIGENPYALVSGNRNLTSQERQSSGQIAVHHFPTGQRQYIELNQLEPTNLYDLGPDYLGIEYRKTPDREYGISILDLKTPKPFFVSFPSSDQAEEDEQLKSIVRYDKTLRLVNLLSHQSELEYPVPAHIQDPFDLWIDPERQAILDQMGSLGAQYLEYGLHAE